MNPDIARLILHLDELAPNIYARQAAAILHAVFDPENQPSQYGTKLIEAEPAE